MEFHDFEVDDNVVNYLIKSQSGTVPTGLLELVMNSYDAGSNVCDIKINKFGFTVSDKGNGFKDREDIELHFKTFGKAHTEGDATYGRFRIGRGQVMSLGKMSWESNTFKMNTDIINLGNGFNLTEDNEYIEGCRVHCEFYSPLNDWELNRAINEIKKRVKYVDQDITINGFIECTKDKEAEWDLEQGNLKIKWETNPYAGINLYSLGVFVKELDRSNYGFSADIITNKALELNMARNEISEASPLWKEINEVLKRKSIEEAKKKSKSLKMDISTRNSVVNQFYSGDVLFSSIEKMKLIRDCRGHFISINALWNTNLPVTIAEKLEMNKAHKIALRKGALVLHSDELMAWSASSLKELIDIFRESAIDECMDYEIGKIDKIKLIDINQLSKGMDGNMEVVKSSILNNREKSAFNAIKYANTILAKRLMPHLENYYGNEDDLKRNILVGKSDVADGWTDGNSYIAVNRSMLNLLDKGEHGAVQIAMLLIHEYCHNTSNVTVNEHDFEFYEMFHNVSSDYVNEVLGHTASSIYHKYQTELVSKIEPFSAELKNKYKWPIVNDSKEYKGAMDGRPLSAISKMTINHLKLNINASKVKFTAVFNGNNFHNNIKRLNNAIVKDIKSNNIPFPDIGQYENIYRNHKEKMDAYVEACKKPLLLWAKNQKHDPDFVIELFETINIKRFTADDLFVLLCKDKNSGMYSFEREELFPLRVFGSKDYLFNYKSLSRKGQYEYMKIDSESFIDDQEQQFMFALDGVKNILNGFKDEKTKKEFFDRFMNDDLLSY